MARHYFKLLKVLMCFVFLWLWGGSLVATATSTPTSFAPLVKRLMPAVVNIACSSQSSKEGRSGPSGVPGLEMFPPQHQEFFERFFGFPPGFRVPEEEERRVSKPSARGSGFLIDADGHVVTNYHVIEHADEIQVILHDQTKLDAKVVGFDKKTDLALLKVARKQPFDFVSFGHSSTAQVGDWVLAIGNPFGLGGTVTAGIISALARDIQVGPFDDFLQTDAAINFGNSGGPMFNTEGEVIGINTVIYSPSGGGSVGIGFAIPSDLASPLIEQLKKTGVVRRAFLGIGFQPVTKEIAESLNLENEEGVAVTEVHPGGAAERAGIKPGDIILSFDGKKITQSRKFPRVVAETPISQAVDVELLRAGEKIRLRVTLGELKEKSTSESSETQANPSGKHYEEDGIAATDWLGAFLAPIDEKIRERLSIDPKIKGLAVMGVKRQSSASQSGLQRGDIILGANQQPVTRLSDLQRIVSQARKEGRKRLLLSVLRGQQSYLVTLLL
jgi:serine protease Do